jgi:threonine aldolase
MTNQIAVKVHTQPGDEILCSSDSHVYKYEGGGIAYNSGCSVRLIQGDRGRIKHQDILDNINPDDVHFPVSRLVVIENTANKGGGSYYNIDELNKIAEVCKDAGLRLHLDGARLFNAIVETGTKPNDYGKVFDSISICLSKGLGAPVGSLLLGNSDFIKESRRKRKVMGGGMRQAGYLASAGIYALENNIERLREDHMRAKILAGLFEELPLVKEISPVDTNIVILHLKEGVDEVDFLNKLKMNNILAVGFGPMAIRMVSHLDFLDADLERVGNILNKNFK